MACILIIEDDEPLVRLMKWVLEENNHQVAVAKAPEEAALKLEIEIDPDVIVINSYQSPEAKKSAIKLLRELCPGVGIIDLAQRVGNSGYDTGADEYLNEPFLADDLEELIKKILVEKKLDED